MQQHAHGSIGPANLTVPMHDTAAVFSRVLHVTAHNLRALPYYPWPQTKRRAAAAAHPPISKSECVAPRVLTSSLPFPVYKGAIVAADMKTNKRCKLMKNARGSGCAVLPSDVCSHCAVAQSLNTRAVPPTVLVLAHVRGTIRPRVHASTFLAPAKPFTFVRVLRIPGLK